MKSPGTPGLYVLALLDPLCCAFPIAAVAEVTRVLPVQAIAGAPAFVAGMTIIRGEQTPVLDLRSLLAAPPKSAARFVVLRAGRRQVALAVDHVVGVERVAADAIERASFLLTRAGPGSSESLAAFDGALLLALQAARLMPAGPSGVAGRGVPA